MSTKQAKKRAKKAAKAAARATFSNSLSAAPMGNHHIPLRGFNQKQVPDCTLIKMVYADYRAVASAAGQGSYVYRFNSCFDPDATGVGGQPDGFDQWKTLYQQYRVVACGVHVECQALATVALCTVTPSVSITPSSSAEEQVGLRRSKGKVCQLGGMVAKFDMLLRPSDTFGVPDQHVLDNNDFAATTTSNPNSAAYVKIEMETAGATDSVQIFVVLTMYTRFEKPVETQDTLRSGHGGETVTAGGSTQVFQNAVAAAASSPAVIGGLRNLPLPGSAIPTSALPYHAVGLDGRILDGNVLNLTDRLRLMETRLERALDKMESRQLTGAAAPVVTDK